MWLLLALACHQHEVAPYLNRPQLALAVDSAPATDLPSAIAALIGDDPLARRLSPGTPGRFAALPGGDALEAWATMARAPAPSPTAADIAALEQRWPGTVAVALARGTALGWLETRVTMSGAVDQRTGHDIFPWFGPFVEDDHPLPPDAQGLWSWLGPLAPEDAPRRVLDLAERRVLLGWLDGPTIPLGPVAALLQDNAYERLNSQPAGALVLARGLGRSDAEAGARGATTLSRATELALTEVAADTDAEQRDWRARHEALSSELALGPHEDPVLRLLERATSDLTLDAASDASTGLALVAISAARLHGPCAPGLCRDFDRTSGLVVAQRWSPAVGPLALAWQVWALKSVADALEVALERPSLHGLIPDLVDALAGTGGARYSALVLRRSRPTPQLFLDLSRGAGGPDQVDGPGLLSNLQTRLKRQVELAQAAEQRPEIAALLERIGARATR